MKTPWLVGSVVAGVFRALLTVPMACGECRRMTVVVANRNGVTRCLACDERAECSR